MRKRSLDTVSVFLSNADDKVRVKYEEWPLFQTCDINIFLAEGDWKLKDSVQLNSEIVQVGGKPCLSGKFHVIFFFVQQKFNLRPLVRYCNNVEN